MLNDITPIADITGTTTGQGLVLTSFTGNTDFYNFVLGAGGKTVSIQPTKTVFNTPVYFGSVNATNTVTQLSSASSPCAQHVTGDLNDLSILSDYVVKLPTLV